MRIRQRLSPLFSLPFTRGQAGQGRQRARGSERSVQQDSAFTRHAI
jgi:hypothetical protein